MIISDNIAGIITYYKEEGIRHESIALYAYMTYGEFRHILKLIQKNIPQYKIKYFELEPTDTQLCQISECDLSIVMPDNFIASNPGKFQYKFQSHIKNIFGTMAVVVGLANGSIRIKNQQIFTTSIGKKTENAPSRRVKHTCPNLSPASSINNKQYQK